MRISLGRVVASLISGLVLFAPELSLAQDLIPAKRLVLSENTDLPGSDITSIFDTTLDACQRACLSNKACEAFTFNTHNGSCKSFA